MIQALRRLLGENDLMAYLTMMTNRLLELHRVLKPTGSLYNRNHRAISSKIEISPGEILFDCKGLSHVSSR